MKELWSVDIENVDGKIAAVHTLVMDPDNYEDRRAWNAAHRSFYWFRQRERGNLKCNRDVKSKVQFAASCYPPDNLLKPFAEESDTTHQTVWALYDAIKYDYTKKKYIGDPTQGRPLDPDAAPAPVSLRGRTPCIVHMDTMAFYSESPLSGEPTHQNLQGVDPAEPGGEYVTESTYENGKLVAFSESAAVPSEAYSSPEEKEAHADSIRKAIKMPDPEAPVIVAHKRGVVKAHQKLLRKQERARKFREAQRKAFDGK